MNNKAKNIWGTFQSGNQDPTQALLDWKAMLAMIIDVHEASKLARMAVPELSRLFKRVNDENGLEVVVKRAKVVPKKAEEGREIIEID
jgi:hypothetical protein